MIYGHIVFRMNRKSFALIVIAVMAVLLVTLFSIQQRKPSIGGEIAPSMIRFIASDAVAPPDFSRATTVRLPYQWDAGKFHSGWFELSWNAPAGAVDGRVELACLLRRLNMNAALFLNGRKVGDGGPMDVPVARHWHSPLIFDLPAAMVKPGVNRLQLHLVVSRPGTIGLLGRVMIGPGAQLHPYFSTIYSIGYGMRMTTIVLSVVVGVVMLFLWMLRRNGEYFWFSVLNLVSAFGYLNGVVVYIPTSTWLWECIMQLSIGWIPILVAVFIHHMIHNPWPIYDKIVVIIGLAFFPAIFFIEPQSIFSFARIWHVISLAAGLIALFQLLAFLRKNRDGGLYIIWGAIFMVALIGTHDMLTVHHGGEGWISYSALLLTTGILFLLVHRFAMNSMALETSNETLERRVAEAEQQIEQDMRVIHLMEQEQAVASERGRIYRDLHDDLGAKILSLVYRSDNVEQRKIAREAMAQLRKIIDSGGDKQPDLDHMMRMWRDDCLRRSLEAGKSLHWPHHHWQVSEQLAPEISSQISFVLKESITNALKHGCGDKICVKTRGTRQQLVIWIRNGIKPHAEVVECGHGVQNMRRRVAEMGGKIRWKINRSAMCQVLIVIPLKR